MTIPVTSALRSALVKKDRLILAGYRLLIRDHISVGLEKQIQKICSCELSQFFKFLDFLSVILWAVSARVQ